MVLLNHMWPACLQLGSSKEIIPHIGPQIYSRDDAPALMHLWLGPCLCLYLAHKNLKTVFLQVMPCPTRVSSFSDIGPMQGASSSLMKEAHIKTMESTFIKQTFGKSVEMGDCHMVGPIVLLINHKSITQSLFITFSFEREQIDWESSKGKGANCRSSLMQNGEAEKAHRCSPAQPVDKRRCKRFKGNIWRVNISLSETPYRPRLVACLMTNWISLVWSTKTEEPPTHIRLGF